MCNFFSAISNGEKTVRFFSIEDVCRIMCEGNHENYNFNSHTSIAHFFGLKPEEEDKWNKWEYCPSTKELTADKLVAADDRKNVQSALDTYFNGKDVGYMQHIYNCNTGNGNTGNSNTGYRNTGNSNTGYRNTGNSNTGYSNTGNSNTGDSNTGYSNTGYSNTGYSNTGYSNTGDSNTGDRNTGDYNTGNGNTGNSNTGYSNIGNGNTGYSNTGNCNTGYSNTGYGNTGWFNTTEPMARFFNKESNIKLTDFYKSGNVPIINISLIVWVDIANMTDDEKKSNPNSTTIGGYLKARSYKDAWAEFWKTTDNANKEKVLALPNFDATIFEEITGIKV